MGATLRGYPYPEPTDPVSAGADAIKLLATEVDTRLRSGTARGTANIALSNVATAAMAVTFPAGRFTAPPTVVASCEVSTFFACAFNITATGCSVQARHFASTATTQTVPVDFIAVST